VEEEEAKEDDEKGRVPALKGSLPLLPILILLLLLLIPLLLIPLLMLLLPWSWPPPPPPPKPKMLLLGLRLPLPPLLLLYVLQEYASMLENMPSSSHGENCDMLLLLPVVEEIHDPPCCE
jgi:RsiW-degrading membrane proteinase PrsW (M82 family)